MFENDLNRLVVKFVYRTKYNRQYHKGKNAVVPNVMISRKKRMIVSDIALILKLNIECVVNIR